MVLRITDDPAQKACEGSPGTGDRTWVALHLRGMLEEETGEILGGGGRG
jgi:hypothetical protein